MKKSLLLSLLVLFSLSCAQPAVGPPQKTNNEHVSVEVLFQKDGYTVYRFTDNGFSHYYVTPVGETISLKNCGKGCVRPENIQTK